MQMDMERIKEFIRKNEPYILLIAEVIVYGIIIYSAVRYFEVWHGN